MAELEQQYAVIGIPENTVEFTIIASVYLDGKIEKFQAVYNMADVKKAVSEIQKWNSHKLPVLAVSFEGENVIYKVASFNSEVTLSGFAIASQNS